ncbi:Hypothetical predicted protein [Olea europaea subsp. europaea]|uniref:Uncharacterized protein n=1 Tax=Olea europaea subsp. europaea TaxID=158383 RepID=A0A8S0RH85_OLEEU|nr:Hypothetical predicted protein [Olea europaea subsp. europaea]
MFSEAVKERKRLKPQDLDQNMELAQWVNDCSESFKKAQAISGPYRYKSNVYGPIIPNHLGPNLNFNSHAFPYHTTYIPNPTPMVIPNITEVTIRPPTPMEKGPPIKRSNETQMSVKSMVKAFTKRGQGVLLELGCFGVEIEEIATEALNFIAQVLQQNRSVFKWLNELALATLELTLIFEIPTKYDDIGIDTKNRKHHEELWKFANQIHKLEVSSFNREDPKTNEFLGRKEREAVAIYLDGEVVAWYQY